MTVCLLIEYSLSLQVHPVQKKFVRQQSFKKSTVSTDRAKPLASNRKAAGNSVFGTVMWPFCIIFRSPLFGNFHKKKMWALKVEKDGYDPNTFSSLKEILRLVIICRGKFSVYWSVDHFHVQYITFQFIVNYDKFSVLILRIYITLCNFLWLNVNYGQLVLINIVHF